MTECTMRQIILGGIDFQVQFHYPLTWIRYFRDFQALKKTTDFSENIAVSPEEIQNRMQEFGSGPFTEFNLLLSCFANRFLCYNRCIFHGVAICVEGQAWLITAPSGTGKSTQYFHWKKLYGEKIRLICGDKPILEFQDSGDIIVHSSPWTGKECWKGSGASKLAGIVYLEQGKCNDIRPMAVSEAVVPLYTQFLYQPFDEMEIQKVSFMLDKILRTVPVWKLINVGDEASVRLMHDKICVKERRSV